MPDRTQDGPQQGPPQPESPAARRLTQIRAERRRLEEEERAIYRASIRETDPALKMCEDGIAELLAEPSLFPRLEPPFWVAGIAWAEHAGEGWIERPWEPTEKWPMPWCSVRLVGDDSGRTYLGIMLGDVYTSMQVSLSADGVLAVGPAKGNPCMYVPALQRLVFGYGSWWSPLTDPERVREISDADLSEWGAMVRTMVAAVTARGAGGARGANAVAAATEDQDGPVAGD